METKLKLRWKNGRFIAAIDYNGVRVIAPNCSLLPYDFATLVARDPSGSLPFNDAQAEIIELVDKKNAELALREIREELEAERARAIEMVKRNAHAEGYAAGLAAARTTAQSQEVDKLKRQIAEADRAIDVLKTKLHKAETNSCDACYQSGSREAQIKAEKEFAKIREEAQAAVNAECERATKAEAEAERIKATYYSPHAARVQGRNEGRETGYQEGKAESAKIIDDLRTVIGQDEAKISALIESQKNTVMQKDLVIAALRGEKIVEFVAKHIPGPETNFTTIEIDGRPVHLGDWYTRPDGLVGYRFNIARGAAEKAIMNYDGGRRAGEREGRKAVEREMYMKGEGHLATVIAARDSWIKLAGEYRDDVERLTKRIAELAGADLPELRTCRRCTEFAFTLMSAWGIKLENGQVIDGRGSTLSEEDQAALEMGRVLFDRRLAHLRRHGMDEKIRDRHQKAFWKIDKLARRALGKE